LEELRALLGLVQELVLMVAVWRLLQLAQVPKGVRGTQQRADQPPHHQIPATAKCREYHQSFDPQRD
jgi:hypothetical protein